MGRAGLPGERWALTLSRVWHNVGLAPGLWSLLALTSVADGILQLLKLVLNTQTIPSSPHIVGFFVGAPQAIHGGVRHDRYCRAHPSAH
ncbi:hypothetical protein GGX14DRAFT_579598 [Mycena pura]|uniref:Uncharacterized protein n=1 Tax=Mycena pura TaxID=153505 RepID=A0AAD6UMU6_9AGAR|nr:hypothetical protein GGX14DRAFT_579598 [Mycena pura]